MCLHNYRASSYIYVHIYVRIYRVGHKSLDKNACKSQIYVKRLMAQPVVSYPLYARRHFVVRCHVYFTNKVCRGLTNFRNTEFHFRYRKYLIKLRYVFELPRDCKLAKVSVRAVARTQSNRRSVSNVCFHSRHLVSGLRFPRFSTNSFTLRLLLQ
jgi:hypothetical protein